MEQNNHSYHTLQDPWVWKVSIPLLQCRQQCQRIWTEQLRVPGSWRRPRPQSWLFKAWPFQQWTPAPPGSTGLQWSAEHDCGSGWQARGHQPPHLQPLQHGTAVGPVEQSGTGSVSPSSPSDRRLHHTSYAPWISPWQRRRVEPVSAVPLLLLVRRISSLDWLESSSNLLRGAQIWECMPKPCRRPIACEKGGGGVQKGEETWLSWPQFSAQTKTTLNPSKSWRTNVCSPQQAVSVYLFRILSHLQRKYYFCTEENKN